MSKQKSNPLSATSNNEEGLNSFCAIRERRDREDREERLRKLLTLQNNEEFKKDKQKYLYLLNQLPVFIDEVINDTRNSILPKNEEHNTDKKSSPDIESTMNKRIKSLKELDEEIRFELLKMDPNIRRKLSATRGQSTTQQSNLTPLRFVNSPEKKQILSAIQGQSKTQQNNSQKQQPLALPQLYSEPPQTLAPPRINIIKFQLNFDKEIPAIPTQIPGLQIGLVDSQYYDATYYDFLPTITPRIIPDLQINENCQSSITPPKGTKQNRDSVPLTNSNIHAEILTPRIIPDLQIENENYQSSSTPSKEKQQNRDAVSLINNNIRAEVIKYLFIEVFRAIEEIYEGNHTVEMIKEFNANVEEIFLITKHLTKEFAEPKTSEKHLHLKKLKKITETLKIFIDESPLSYLISEKDLILKKNVSKENSADKKKIDLKIKYSLGAINNQSKKFEKRLLETAKFLDNQNIQSTKPSTDTISAFAENVLEKSTNAKKQKHGRD